MTLSGKQFDLHAHARLAP